MKKSMRYITLILAAIFLIAGTMLVAYADTGVDSGVDSGSGGVDSGSDQGGGEGGGSDQGGGEGGGSDQVVDPGVDPDVDPGVDPGSGSGDSGSGDSGSGSDDGGYVDPGYVDPGYVDPGNGGNNYDDGSNTGSDNGSYNNTPVYYDEDPLFYGDASNYDYNTSVDNDKSAGTIDTELYPTKLNTSDSIKAQKWEDLELPTDNNNVKLNSGNAAGDVSFASMQKNTAKGDDMGYIPYIGFVCIALSALGILYFIIATVSARKTAKATAGAPATVKYPENNVASADEFKKQNTTRSRTGGHYADDYADGYSASTRKGAKATTGEINLPRRFK